MKNDEILTYLKDLRNEILHEGLLKTSQSVTISGTIDQQKLKRKFPPPKGAKSFFIGDPNGGSGWEVEHEDGTTTKFYVNFDQYEDLDVESRIHLSNAPSEVREMDIEEIGNYYINYLSKLLDEARSKFLN